MFFSFDAQQEYNTYQNVRSFVHAIIMGMSEITSFEHLIH